MTGPEFENKNSRRGTEGGGDEFIPVISKPGADRTQMIGRVMRHSNELPEPQFVDLVDVSGIPKILQVDAAAIERNLELLADHGVEPYTVINGSAPQPPESYEADINLSPTHSPVHLDQMLGRTLRPTPAEVPGRNEFSGTIIDESHHADSSDYEIVDPTRPPEGYITTDEIATRILGDNHLRNLHRSLRDMIDLTKGYDDHAQVIDPIEPVGEIAPQPPQQQGEIS